jgi:hypothetical protein
MSEKESELVLSETGRMVIEDIMAATETHRLYGRDSRTCNATVMPVPVLDRDCTDVLQGVFPPVPGGVRLLMRAIPT